MKSKLPLTEDLDFAYLLQLLPPLYEVEEFSWLSELFSIVGHEALIDLCRYAGGETIKIPTLDQLSDAIESLQYFYDIHIKKSTDLDSVPVKYRTTVNKIMDVYNARNYKK